jgi:hypothetical protein
MKLKEIGRDMKYQKGVNDSVPKVLVKQRKNF